jgi:glucose-6-phosphate 1-dehydrogenase
MPEIIPQVSRQDLVCEEIPGGPAAFVVFGASGDLAEKKLFPSLYGLFKRELLSKNFYLLGCGRTKLSDEQFRRHVRDGILENLRQAGAAEAESFSNNFYYASGDYDEPNFYNNIRTRLAELDKNHNVDAAHIFYLAVPPLLYETIVQHLGTANLSCPGNREPSRKARLVVEKPFGRDLESARRLDEKIHKCFQESQIYRIDHYLGKETVQNILMFRFANAIFEPVWNRNYIDHVQIAIAESVGVAGRGGYYDRAGVLRDMFQNHMLGMLALVAMEPPVSFDADGIRDEKVKLLRSIRPFNLDNLDASVVRGQYVAGSTAGQSVPAYRDEEGIDPQSKTETSAAARLLVDNWRWKSVPFYCRTGKRLAAKDTEIAITFKKVPHSMFVSAGLDDMPANVLVMQIQPEEGMSLSFQAKRPGSKICMSTLNMNLRYKEVFAADVPEAYQRLLLDCMLGDQTLFPRQDDVEISWRLLTPVLEAWEKDPTEPHQYPAGAESFPAADNLIESDGRKWRKIGYP